MRLARVEGQTYPIDVVLRAAGVPIAFAPGDTVTLLLKTQDGLPVTLGGTTAILAPDPAAGITEGTVRYTPAPGDLLARHSPYLARWKITRATGIAFAPSDVEDRWDVRAP